MVRVSVVIPVYNAEPYLRECLDSAIGQTFEEIEIICVDDGSTDGSREILHEYARRDGRIGVIEQGNLGASGARNRGMDIATGEYLLFLDADDYLELTAVEDAYAQCVADEADIGIFKIRYAEQDTGVSVVGDWSLRMDLVPGHVPFSPADMRGSLFRFVTPTVWNKMLRRSFVQERGLRFSTQLKRAEDVAFIYLALATARRITVVDRALVTYRKSTTGTLRATVHETPLSICWGLATLKRDAVAADVFDEIERDFVNVALDECLFTLETIGTPEAFRELYEALQNAYVVDLGIAGHDPEYFYDRGQYEKYTKITRLSWTEYLFEETISLRESLTDKRIRMKESRARLRTTKTQLQQVQGSRSYRLAQRAAAVSRRIRRLVVPTSRKAG